MKKPKVSVLCLTYNHEKIIKQALDSFLMQKTNFNFEVLIHDDASTDNTIQIIKEYQKKYPQIIKPIFEIENQFSKGVRGFVAKILIPKAQGEYLSLCEGDDFFTDPNKLQKQVDFLDKHPNYSICFHPIHVFFENKEEDDLTYPIIEDRSTITLTRLLKENYIPTNSVLYRKQKKYNNLPTNIMPGDWYLHLYHAQFGKIGFINQVMSSYRRHSKGIWWNSYNDQSKLLEKFGLNQMALFFEMLKLYGNRKNCQNIIMTHVDNLLTEFAQIDENKDKTLVKQAFEKFPKLIHQLILHKSSSATQKRFAKLEEKILSQNIHTKELKSQINQLNNQINNLTKTNRHLNNQINIILNTKKWRLINKLDQSIPPILKKHTLALIKKCLLTKNKLK